MTPYDTTSLRAEGPCPISLSRAVWRPYKAHYACVCGGTVFYLSFVFSLIGLSQSMQPLYSQVTQMAVGASAVQRVSSLLDMGLCVCTRATTNLACESENLTYIQ